MNRTLTHNIGGPSRQSSAVTWPGPRKRNPARIGGFLRLAFALAVLDAASGCYHVIKPVRALPLSEDAAFPVLDRPRTIRLVNGYRQEELYWLHTDGIHHLGVDFREWTDRLIAELKSELEPLQVTSLTVLETPPGDDGETIPSLTLWVAEIRAPTTSGGGGAALAAELASKDGSYMVKRRSEFGAHGFADAFFDLKKAIIEDPLFATWLEKVRSD